MGKAPGHEKWPDHKIEERRIGQRVKADVSGHGIADSSDVIRLDEDDHPSRYYFPRSDVKMDMLKRSDTTTKCPFKGTAQYFNVTLGDLKLDDAAWSYEDPFDEHYDLKDRLAFHDDKMKEIEIRPPPAQDV